MHVDRSLSSCRTRTRLSNLANKVPSTCSSSASAALRLSRRRGQPSPGCGVVLQRSLPRSIHGKPHHLPAAAKFQLLLGSLTLHVSSARSAQLQKGPGRPFASLTLRGLIIKTRLRSNTITGLLSGSLPRGVWNISDTSGTGVSWQALWCHHNLDHGGIVTGTDRGCHIVDPEGRHRS